MRKPALLGAAVAASTVVLLSGASVAYAQDEPADCAAAITALTDANTAHQAAVADDKAADEAEAAQKVFEDAVAALDNAEREAALNNVTETTAADLAKRRQELRDLEAQPTEELDEKERERIIRWRDVVIPLVENVIRARNDRDEAEKAAEADEVALRATANATDADALAEALDEARADFDRLCVDGEEDPTVSDTLNCDDFSTRAQAQAKFDEDTSDPHQLDADGNGLACERAFDENIGADPTPSPDADNDNVVIPQGGVATGGGPA